MNIPILRILGKSNSGKTTFIDKLIEKLPELNIAVIKHTNHTLNKPENHKDTGNHYSSGAKMVAGLSPNNGELFFKDPCMMDFHELVTLFKRKSDLLLIEGAREYSFKTILLGDIPDNAVVDDIAMNLKQRPEIDNSLVEKIKNIINYDK